MKLLDKVALVTGGAKRVGREIALSLANDGCDIVLHYRSSCEEAEALAREIRSLGRQAWCVCGDFSNAYEPAITMKTAWDLAGWIDILVNNASLYTHTQLNDISVAEMETLWRVNSLAPMLLARTMYELSLESRVLPPGYLGRVINILDRSITKTPSENTPYWLSKKQLAAFTQAAAMEFSPRFVVNGVAPGPVLAPEKAELSELAGPIPLAVRPTAHDVADAVLYLARAQSLTGQILYVDGGQHLL